jgi:hypothetical protein
MKDEMEFKRVIALLAASMLAAVIVGIGLPGPGAVAEAQTTSTEELSGVLNVRWIDPPEHSAHEHELDLVLAGSGGSKTDHEVDGEALRRGRRGGPERQAGHRRG